MGGPNGEVYSRDTIESCPKTTHGTTREAEQQVSKKQVDQGLLPKGCRLTCVARNPIVFGMDITGSNIHATRILWDKAPMVAGQIPYYFKDPEISVSAIGDITCDDAPIQICNFDKMRNLDEWLNRIWLEGGGGKGYFESYEYLAWFYANCCDMPNAEVPIFIFLADECFRNTLDHRDLERHFGGEHETTYAETVFADLRRNFMGNVFMIRRLYDADYNDRILQQWKGVLGTDHIATLCENDVPSIFDVALGICAIVGGSRTLDTYLQDLRTQRASPQTESRIQNVRRSLANIKPMTPAQAQAPREKSSDWL